MIWQEDDDLNATGRVVVNIANGEFAFVSAGSLSMRDALDLEIGCRNLLSIRGMVRPQKQRTAASSCAKKTSHDIPPFCLPTFQLGSTH
jgi:hypothetical protein